MFNSNLTGLVTIGIPFWGGIFIFLKSKLISYQHLTIYTYIWAYFQFILGGICFISNSDGYYNLGTWFSLGMLQVDFTFIIDPLTKIMICLITSVTFCVQIYSLKYMQNDPECPRFISFLFFFEFFMLILVTSGNFVLLFLGWEGVGLVSYLLINFWNTRIAANKAALKAIIVNKVGDVALLIAMCYCFYLFNTLDFIVINSLVSTLPDLVEIKNLNLLQHQIDFLATFLLIGAAAKSAQLGLHTWLPDAMEGPSPVSALIHAATMVTAGVFLICRCSAIFEASPFTSNLCVILGAVTVVFASTTALAQYDLKKIIAFSTCSQLGYMFMCCGLSGYNLAMFHLFNHGFFKAALFLGAGAVIHACNNEQDIRRMGNITNFLFFFQIMSFIGATSLMGLPSLAGFYSKDAILQLAYTSSLPSASYAYILATTSVYLTSLYSLRQFFMLYLIQNKNPRDSILTFHKQHPFIIEPIFLLSIAGIFAGYFFNDLFIGLGTPFWNNSIVISNSIDVIDIENVPTYYKLLPLNFSLLGVFLIELYHSKYFQDYCPYFLTNFEKTIFKFLSNKWYFDSIYNYFIVKPTLFLGHRVTYEILDRGFFELFGPLGVVKLITKFEIYISNLQTGFLYHYIFTIISYIISVICYIFIGYFNENIYNELDPLYLVYFLLSLLNPSIQNDFYNKNKQNNS